MMTMLVAGGTGGVGEAIVRELTGAGHRIVVPSRSDARLARLRRDVATHGGSGTLVTMTDDIGTLAGAIAIRDRIACECGRLDVVIPSLGGWWQGALTGVSLAEWDAVMHEMLRTHFIFANTFVPALRAQPGGGRYLALGGGAAYHPIRNASLVSIAAAAQLMMTRALRLEVEDPNVDILELVVDGPVRTRDSEAIAGEHWIGAADVARIARQLAETGITHDPATETRGPIVRMRPADPKRGAA